MAAGGSARLVREKEEEEKRNTVAGKDKGERRASVARRSRMAGTCRGRPAATRAAARQKQREGEGETDEWGPVGFLFSFPLLFPGL